MESTYQTNFMGDPNLGLFGFATEKYCIIGPSIGNKKKIEETLGTKIFECKALGTDLVGIFIAGNSRGVVVPDLMDGEEVDGLRKHLEVLVLKTRFTALGNLILMNDKGCIISEMIAAHKNEIERFFGLECSVSKSRIGVIGSAAISNENGCVIHPNMEESEAKMIEKILDVSVDTGTANFGSPFVGSCIIANSKGLIVSEQSTGIEISRLEEILFPDR